MFAFLSSRQLLLITHRNRRTQFQLGLLQKKAIFSIKSFTSIALSESEQQKTHSFTVSYLINSCGLSPKSALLASHKVHFENPDKPDLVLNLLKESGFNDSQITKFVTKIPLLLLSHPENTLLPKFEFLRSIGVSGSDLPRILSLNPDMLRRSLKNNLIPCYDFLKSLLLENEKVITTLGRSQRTLLSNGTKTMVPNVALLREVGAPPSTISFLVTRSPSVAFIKPSKFVKAVQEVKEMGFDPSKFAFVQAIEVVLSIKKPTWEYKFEIFSRWGWSKEDTLLAFRRFPNFMLLSDEKITKVMNFVVNKLGRPSADILMNPVVLNLSLEKRIIPRCSVVQILLAKNLIKSDLSLATFLLPNEKFFLEKFVIKFQDTVPQLLSVYQTKMDLLDVEIQSEKDDDDDISGDEDMSFGSAEDDDEPEETPKKVESSKKRPSESATKTPVPAKKAKAATPQKTDGKKVGGHTATPHPSKKGAKTLQLVSNLSRSPQNLVVHSLARPTARLSALKLVFSPTQRPSMLAISDWAITTFAAVA